MDNETLTLDALKEAISTGVKEGLPKLEEPEGDTPPLLPELKADQLIALDEDGTPIVKSRQDVLLEQYEASMGQGLLVAIERPINQAISGPLGGIKVGSIGVGSFVGLTVSELVDGFSEPAPRGAPMNFTNLGLKGLAAFGVNQFGPMLMSRDATNFAIAVLGATIIADILPIDVWVNRLVNFFRGIGRGQSALSQAEQVAQRAWSEQPGVIVPASADLMRNVW